MTDISSSGLHSFHLAARKCHMELVRLRELTVRYRASPEEARKRLRRETIHQYLLLLWEPFAVVGSHPEATGAHELLIRARLALGLATPRFAGLATPSVHALAFSAPMMLFRAWNLGTRPDAPEAPPSSTFTLFAPTDQLDVALLMARFARYFADQDISSFGAELEVEYVKASELLKEEQAEQACGIQLKGDVWHVCYRGEIGEYPERGYKALRWLAKLLSAPNKSRTPGDLLGDPDSKLAAVATLGSERTVQETDLAQVKRRYEELQEISSQTGGSEEIDNEMTLLIRYVEDAAKGARFVPELQLAHKNIATQLRALFNKRLEPAMPKLAGHLRASLRMSFPTLGYFPPKSHPSWKVDEGLL